MTYTASSLFTSFKSVRFATPTQAQLSTVGRFCASAIVNIVAAELILLTIFVVAVLRTIEAGKSFRAWWVEHHVTETLIEAVVITALFVAECARVSYSIAVFIDVKANKLSVRLGEFLAYHGISRQCQLLTDEAIALFTVKAAA